jgi:hypothetical protein
MKQALSWGAVAAALLGTLGCVEDHCPPLSECGGSVLSNGALDFYQADGLVDTEWWSYGGDECQDPLYTPPTEATLLNQPPHLSNEAPPERTSTDWCSNLVFNDDRTIKSLNLWFPQIPMRSARLRYSAATDNATEGIFEIQFRYFKEMRADFSAQCMTAQGVVMGCTEFTYAVRDELAQEPNIDPEQINCFPGPQGGCSCAYDMLLVSGVTGPWRRNGDLITHYNDFGDFPAETDYCVNGNSLEMTGHDRTWLFNQGGLRTLKFVRSTCADGDQNQNEAGVDCGVVCGVDCPESTCADGMKNANEQAIDCGGVCGAACPPCNNGTQDGDEQGTDCGGSCPTACP